MGEAGNNSGFMFPEMSPLLPQSFNTLHFPSNQVHYHDPFNLFPPVPSPYGGLFNRRSSHFGLQDELQKVSGQEIMDAKAIAASKSHSEAERRRRERINNHLSKLRSLLPSTTKTDKASLLAEVIQHVKELKRQTSQITDTNSVPTEMDELTIDNYSSDEEGRNVVMKASLCCEDRSDLLADLIKTLKSLRLRILKAEITTLGGRVKNVLFVTQSKSINDDQLQYSLSSIQEALKAVIEKSSGTSGIVKRQIKGLLK